MVRQHGVAAPVEVVRPVEEGDVGVLALLAQLTDVSVTTPAAFAQRVRELDSGPEHVFVVVGEGGALLATATLLLERKIAHGCGLCAHVEDVVVDEAARGRGIGRMLVEELVEKARRAGCYKVILNCSRGNAGFYEACGFARREQQMALYF